ncbi:hypothetical protein PR202_gb11515 [Eleusine coracana subsp. coracana]|uniref:Uncharacterized protein n=1 Tax=Eleusine coracana subsp. coracana TaxID=191504 RepID=A0AAV5EKQ4_ELECO|nr:hypothetical protein PR202_gb11515 [Eleusine coracana subsp. coracana]
MWLYNRRLRTDIIGSSVHQGNTQQSQHTCTSFQAQLSSDHGSALGKPGLLANASSFFGLWLMIGAGQRIALLGVDWNIWKNVYCVIKNRRPLIIYS